MSQWKNRAFQTRNKVEKIPVPIISDPAVATRGVGDGRTIPLLIIDTSQRPDLEDLVNAHKYLGSGDVESGWFAPSRFSTKKLGLILNFKKPIECLCVLEFDVMTHKAVIDLIIQAEGLYLQPGKIGDRLISTMDNPRILCEVPSKSFQKEWGKIHRKVIFKMFRKQGSSRQKAKQETEEFLQEWRKISTLNLGNN
jgi:hypothetical protein